MDNQYILIDTSIIIDHLRKQNKKNSILYNSVDEYQFYTSTIVEFEVFLGATNMQKLHDVKDILQLCEILPLTSEIAQEAATIYQKLKHKKYINRDTRYFYCINSYHTCLTFNDIEY